MQDKSSPKEKNSPTDRLRLCFARSGMSQVELSKAAGLSPGFVSDALKGRKPLSRKAALAFSDALNVPYPWLYIGSGPAPKFAISEPEQTAETAVCPPDFTRVVEPSLAYSPRQRGIAGVPPPLVDAMRLMAEKLTQQELDSIADTLKSLAAHLKNPDEEEALFSTVTFLRRVKSLLN